MTMHREFIDHGNDAPTGVAFTGCHLLSATPAHAPAPAAGTATRRREVVVNGRRVKTVDVHAHCSVPEAMALLGMKIPTPTLLMSQPTDRLTNTGGAPGRPSSGFIPRPAIGVMPRKSNVFPVTSAACKRSVPSGVV